MTTQELLKAGANPVTLELIQLTLECSVPFIIHDLRKLGGPDEYQLEEARAFTTTLGSQGEAILYRVKGKTAEMMDRLIECIAILAFCPGGITTFGLHFEARRKESEANHA